MAGIAISNTYPERLKTTCLLYIDTLGRWSGFDFLAGLLSGTICKLFMVGLACFGGNDPLCIAYSIWEAKSMAEMASKKIIIKEDRGGDIDFAYKEIIVRTCAWICFYYYYFCLITIEDEILSRPITPCICGAV